MQKEINYFSCHFHKVDSLTWLAMRSFLQGIMVQRVERCSDQVCVLVNPDTFQVISDFLFDMDVAYLHPRRDAMHVSLMASQYSNVQIPARTAIISRNSKDVPRAAAKFSPSPKGAIFSESESFLRAPRASSPANPLRK